jgi:chromosome segregation ATPase
MKQRILFSADPEALGGNGPALTVVEAPEASAPVETPVAETGKPGFLESIRASLQSKGTLVAELDTLRAQFTALKDSHGQLLAEHRDLLDKHTALQSERAEIEKLLTEVKGEVTDVQTAAAVAVAAIGFDPSALPAASTSDPETKESLLAELAKETDSKKAYVLAAKINALE